MSVLDSSHSSSLYYSFDLTLTWYKATCANVMLSPSYSSSGSSFLNWTCTLLCCYLLSSVKLFTQWYSLQQWKQCDSPFLLYLYFWPVVLPPPCWANDNPDSSFSCVVYFILQDCSASDNHSYILEPPQMSLGMHPCHLGIHCGNLSSWYCILRCRPH